MFNKKYSRKKFPKSKALLSALVLLAVSHSSMYAMESGQRIIFTDSDTPTSVRENIINYEYEYSDSLPEYINRYIHKPDLRSTQTFMSVGFSRSHNKDVSFNYFNAEDGQGISYGDVKDNVNVGIQGIVAKRPAYRDAVDFVIKVPVPEKMKSRIINPEVHPSIPEVFVTPKSPDIKVKDISIIAKDPIAITEPKAKKVSVAKLVDSIDVKEIKLNPIQIETPILKEIKEPQGLIIEEPKTPVNINISSFKVPISKDPAEIPPLVVGKPQLSGSGANPEPGPVFSWFLGANDANYGNYAVISQGNIDAGKFVFKGTSVDVSGYKWSYYKGTDTFNHSILNTEPPADGTYPVTYKNKFFYVLLNTPYSKFAKDVTIDMEATGSALIDFEIQGLVHTNLDEQVNLQNITAEHRDLLRADKAYANIKSPDTDDELLFENFSTVNLNAPKSRFLFTTTHTDGEKRTSFLLNRGTINANGESSIGFFHTPDTSRRVYNYYINESDGTINLIGKGAMAYAFSASSSGNDRNTPVGVVNRGTIVAAGKSTMGYFFPDTSDLNEGSVVVIKKPIEVTGDKASGVIMQGKSKFPAKDSNVWKANIGKLAPVGEGNDSSGDAAYTEEAMGYLQQNTNYLSSGEFSIAVGEHAKNSVGIYVDQGIVQTKKATDGSLLSRISLDAGKANRGMYIKQDSSAADYSGTTQTVNQLNSTSLEIHGGNANNLITLEHGGKLDIHKSAIIADGNNMDSVLFFMGGKSDSGSDAILNIDADTTIHATIKGKEGVGAYVKEGAVLNMNRNALDAEANLVMEGGMALYNTGGVINAEKMKFVFNKAQAGIVTKGNDAKINIKGSEITYDGDGIAVFSDGAPIDFENGRIILKRGSAFGIVGNGSGNSNFPINFKNGSIEVDSNDAVIFSMFNIGIPPTEVNDLRQRIEGMAGGDIQVTDVDGNAPSYKFIATDNLTILINNPITQTNDAGDFFFRRVALQRSKLDVTSTVTSNLNTNDANTYFGGSVYGLALNSNGLATSNAENTITLRSGSVVESNRMDEGPGAVGVYTAYGQIEIESGATVEVQKDVENKGAVGAYVINGSTLNNAGDIRTHGSNAMGVFALSNRIDEDTNQPIFNEYGKNAVGQGKFAVTNTGTVQLMGKGGVGIYAWNNNPTTPITDATVSNTGLIDVKGEGENVAVGILLDKATLQENTDVADKGIRVGTKSIGIYATNGSHIEKAGRIDLNGSQNVAVLMKDTSTIAAGPIVVKTAASGEDNVAMYYDSNAPEVMIETSIDDREAVGLIHHYSPKNSLTLNVDETLHDRAVGLKVVSATGVAKINAGKTVTLDGVEAKGIVSTAGSKIVNEGEIHIQKEDGIGIYVKDNNEEPAGREVEQKGKILLNGNSGWGIFSLNSTINDEGEIAFAADGDKNIGIIGTKKSIVNINAAKDITNAKKNNLYLFLKNSTANLNEAVAYTSTVPEAEGKGIFAYSEGDNTFAINKAFSIKNGAIGYYAHEGTNALQLNAPVSLEGEETLGFYSTGTMNVSGSSVMTLGSKSIGFYLKNSQVNLKDNAEIQIDETGRAIAFFVDKGIGLGSDNSNAKVIYKNTLAGEYGIGAYFVGDGATLGTELDYGINYDIHEDSKEFIAGYLANKANVIDKKDRVFHANKNVVLAYVDKESKYTNKGNLTIDAQEFIPIYIGSGEGVNEGVIHLTGTGDAASVAIFSNGESTVRNTGTIHVAGKSVGINTRGSEKQEVYNTGTITSQGADSIALWLAGEKTTLTNSGNLRADNVGLYLDHIGEGKVTNTGTFEISATEGVAVYADEATVDFGVTATAVDDAQKVTGVYAKGNSVIGGAVTLDAPDSIGIFAADNAVTFKEGFSVDVNQKSIGLYLNDWKGESSLAASTIDARSGSIGLFVKSNEQEPATVKVGSTINVHGKDAIGIYGNEFSTIGSQKMTLNIDGGTGIFTKGNINVGATEEEALTVNFQHGGTLFTVDDKSITMGEHVTINGTGTLLSGKNLNVDLAKMKNDFRVTADQVGIAVEYDENRPADHNVKNATTFVLDGDNAIGISAIMTAVGANPEANITHEGIIKTTSGTSQIGILSKGLDITSNEVHVGESGIGLYLTNKDLDVKNSLHSETIEIGTKGIGVAAIHTQLKDGEHKLGSITADPAAKETMGFYGESLTGDQVVFKGTTINLQGEEAHGIHLESVTGNYTFDGNAIEIGTKGVGVYAKDSNKISLQNMALELKNNSTGIYAENSQIEVDMSTSTITSPEDHKAFLVVAEGGSTVALNKGGTIDLHDGIAIYAKDSTIDADAPLLVTVHTPDSIGVSAESATISNNITVAVDSDDAIAVRLKGDMTEAPKVSSIKGNNTIGYLVENITKDITFDTSELELDPTSKNQQGVVTLEGAGTGTKIFTKGAKVSGDKSIAIYNAGNYEIHNEGDFVIADTTTEDRENPLIAIYSKSGDVYSKGSTTVGVNSVGYYVLNHNIDISDATLQVKADGTGIYATSEKDQLHQVKYAGELSVEAHKAVGIYSDYNNVEHTGNITVGAEQSFGIYANNSETVTIKASEVKVGDSSLAINIENGKKNTIELDSVTLDQKASGLFLSNVKDTVTDAHIGKLEGGLESIGVYQDNGVLNYTGDITVGETTIAENSRDNKYAIGIYAYNNSTLHYNSGNLTVDKPLSIGVFATSGATIDIADQTTINVKNGAKGIIGGKGVKEIINHGVINVDGQYDKMNEASAGITAYDGVVDNQGEINVTNGGIGIYTAGNATLRNTGKIVVDASSTSTKRPTQEAPAEIGSLFVDKDGVVKIDGRVINGGVIEIKNGEADLDGMAIDVSNKNVMVIADRIKGVAEVTPDFSQGHNDRKMVIQNVFVPKDKGIGEFFGEVKSQSVSWIAKITTHKDENNEEQFDITMAKVPYKEIIKGTASPNFADSLEDLYTKKANDTIEGKVFDIFDSYKTEEELAVGAVELRGDVYANIQERMGLINALFAKSYEDHRNHYNFTKNTNDFSAFYNREEHQDDSLGISGYNAKTIGVLYEKEREGQEYSSLMNYSLGMAKTDFHFTGAVNAGSKEEVTSFVAGVGLRKLLKKYDQDDTHVQYRSDLRFTVHKHETDRLLYLAGNTYTNEANFYTYDVTWNNELSWMIYKNNNFMVRPYVGMDISYGVVPSFTESNGAMLLNVAKNDYLVATPKVGMEYKKYYHNKDNFYRNYVSLRGEVGYHLGNLYGNGNSVGFADSSVGNYALNTPHVGSLYYDIALTMGIEKANYAGIDATISYDSDRQWMYRLTMNRKFN